MYKTNTVPISLFVSPAKTIQRRPGRILDHGVDKVRRHTKLAIKENFNDTKYQFQPENCLVCDRPNQQSRPVRILEPGVDTSVGIICGDILDYIDIRARLQTVVYICYLLYSYLLS